MTNCSIDPHVSGCVQAKHIIFDNVFSCGLWVRQPLIAAHWTSIVLAREGVRGGGKVARGRVGGKEGRGGGEMGRGGGEEGR